ncbi:MAG: hypothetical protein KJ811_00120 [Candidatus Margulisbacteria bacterium]|nr:hypothetical protein [Candidatus Margulisiibacteriota bacterium]
MIQHISEIEKTKILESVVRISAKYNLALNEQKPCLMKLIENGIEFGKRNLCFYVLACELYNKQNKPLETVTDILLRINSEQVMPLKEAEIKSCIKSAQKKANIYACNSLPSITLSCLGRENCPYHKQNFKNEPKRSQGLYTLINNGWIKILSGSELKVYIALCSLERLKSVHPGNRLIASHRQIMRVAGLTRQPVAGALIELHLNGLILYKKGLRHKRNKTASEIIRILPIPYPFKIEKNQPTSGKNNNHYRSHQEVDANE